MATNLKDTIRTTMMGAIPTSVTATSRIKIYAGTKPAKTASPTSAGATLLATLTPAATFSSAGSAGVQTCGAIASDTNAAATGTPTFYRVIDGTTDDGTHTQIQGDCAIGSSDINFSSGIVAGGTVSISALSYTEGNN